MDRRSALKSTGAAVLGLGLAGCRSVGRMSPATRPTPRLALPPVIASWDRIIRTTVGLRPHRPAGFNVSAEKLDDKTVVHNYGHGGAGHSLGWGSGLLSAELALAHPDRRAAVIGCGTVGLTAARQLQRRGFDVSIYAKAVPPDTTSNMALAAFTPTSGLISTEASPAFTTQFRQRGRSVVSPAATTRWPRLRHLVDRQLQHDGQPDSWWPRYQSERWRRGHELPWLGHGWPDSVGRRRKRRPHRARSRRAPVSIAVRHLAAAAADRAVDLSRRAGSRLPDVQRSYRDPRVRHTARSDGARRAQ